MHGHGCRVDLGKLRRALSIYCCTQIECCIRCLAQGVGAAHIIDGRARHSILMELLTDEGVGTMITG